MAVLMFMFAFVEAVAALVCAKVVVGGGVVHEGFGVTLTSAAFAAMIPLFAVNVFEAILASRSFSKPPTVMSSETNDSTDRASSPTTDGTAASLERTEWSRSPSTLVRSFTM